MLSTVIISDFYPNLGAKISAELVILQIIAKMSSAHQSGLLFLFCSNWRLCLLNSGRNQDTVAIMASWSATGRKTVIKIFCHVRCLPKLPRSWGMHSNLSVSNTVFKNWSTTAWLEKHLIKQWFSNKARNNESCTFFKEKDTNNYLITEPYRIDQAIARSIQLCRGLNFAATAEWSRLLSCLLHVYG